MMLGGLVLLISGACSDSFPGLNDDIVWNSAILYLTEESESTDASKSETETTNPKYLYLGTENGLYAFAIDTSDGSPIRPGHSIQRT